MNRGFVIVAQNNHHTNYLQCADVLARRIKDIMPTESVTLLTDTQYQSQFFDNVILFPFGDQCKNQEWKLANDWQVYEASPYEYTIKLEADIYLPRSILNWWDILKKRDLVLCTTIRDYLNNISDCKIYRKTVEASRLPNIYNAITYFKKSTLANNFYSIVRCIFENWPDYREMLNTSEPATTDVVYALAARIVGEEVCTMPKFADMSMIHMKSAINQSRLQDWTKEFIYEIDKDVIRINTIPQLYPFHYHQKHFAQVICKELYEST